jgi:succinate dehydrogenase / fumarate reductase, cytochrome b subunit
LEAQTQVAARSKAMLFWDSLIGKKVVMAVTGAVLVLFVLAHMAGNLKIFAGPGAINSYALSLREILNPELGYGQALWLTRVILLTCAILHIVAATQLTRLNWRARPVGYTDKKNVATTWAAQTMRWGGVLLAIFIVFHILHFTLGAVGFQPGQFVDLMVYQNVVAGFSVWPIAVFYIIAMVALGFHLDHGIWSALQTLGWTTRTNTRSLRLLSRIIALVVFLGFSSVPIAVLAGWVK